MQLPRLIKQSSTYKLKVPKKVEEKIRYLIRKFPHTEWSGILFYTYAGNFEDGSLQIHCEDIFPMDLGTGTFTEFKMDESVTTYIAQNMDTLFDCNIGLLHSHHSMQAWFSGTDISTLQTEGDDTNCFVSLIVNTAGTYCAAITRKLQKSTEIVTKDLGTSYEFFGEGKVSTDEDPMSESTKVIDETVIEYFMLDVEIEQVDNPLAYLDTRFDEIESKKKSAFQPTTMPSLPASRIANPKWGKDGSLIKEEVGKDEEFYDWIHSERKKSAEAKESLLFSEEEMGEIDVTKWKPDPTVIHRMVIHLITCSFIVSDSIDLKQWIHKHMVKKYDEIFSDETMFIEWRDFIIDYLISHYSCEMDIPSELLDEYETWHSKIAEAMVDELGEYNTNSYIDQYISYLMEYITV